VNFDLSIDPPSEGSGATSTSAAMGDYFTDFY
jgi:hypothetical protein